MELFDPKPYEVEKPRPMNTDEIRAYIDALYDSGAIALGDTIATYAIEEGLL